MKGGLDFLNPVNKLWERPRKRVSRSASLHLLSVLPHSERGTLVLGVTPDNPQGKRNPLKFLVVSAAGEAQFVSTQVQSGWLLPCSGTVPRPPLYQAV